MGFYGSNDPTDSVKALKEVVVLRIGFNPTRSTSPCYKPIHACNTYTYMNLSTVKWAQWDKTLSRELLGLFICVCIALCTIVAHSIAQNRPDNFPCYPLDSDHCSDDIYLMEGEQDCQRESVEINGTCLYRQAGCLYLFPNQQYQSAGWKKICLAIHWFFFD